MAWLHATPNEPKGTKGKTIKGAKSRLQRYIDMGAPAKMPPVEHYEHVVSWFGDIGPATVGMSGNIPISYTEVLNWATLMDIKISTFEVTALMKMSKQYCFQSYKSEDPACEPPFMAKVEKEELTVVRQRADDKLRGLF